MNQSCPMIKVESVNYRAFHLCRCVLDIIDAFHIAFISRH